MLKYSNCPLVIVEYGFLSIRKEAELLCDPEYQNKMALAIYLGIMEYLGNRKNPLVYTPESTGKKIVRNN